MRAACCRAAPLAIGLLVALAAHADTSEVIVKTFLKPEWLKEEFRVDQARQALISAFEDRHAPFNIYNPLPAAALSDESVRAILRASIR